MLLHLWRHEVLDGALEEKDPRSVLLWTFFPGCLQDAVHGAGKTAVSECCHDVVSGHTTAIPSPVEELFGGVGGVFVRVSCSEDGIEVAESIFLLPDLDGVEV